MTDIHGGEASFGQYHNETPVHPQMTIEQSREYCFTDFPYGVLVPADKYYEALYRHPYQTVEVGFEPFNLLPGVYEYRLQGSTRVESRCEIILNVGSKEERVLEMPYGEPFTISLYSYHSPIRYEEWIDYEYCKGSLYRIGD